MLETEVAIVGGGPAGLSATIEAARRGVKCTLLDENERAGGQLFKQIHKFFGSKEHFAGSRGFDIGKKLLQDVQEHSDRILLDSPVYGIFENKVLAVLEKGQSRLLKAKKIIFATGASEKVIHFPGWTLPGVMGAGAVQTMVNLHRVLPGKKFLIVGAGNVGLIVAYQLLQAGAKVRAIIEAASKVGGYYVHANKMVRLRVPILTSYTIKEAHGEEGVEAATIVALDDDWNPISGTEERIETEIICLAVGLKPRIDLALIAGCETIYLRELGGEVPLHDENMETTQPGIYVVGDASGIEEASIAVEEGRLAGVAVAEELNYLKKEDAKEVKNEIRSRLTSLRSGPFGDMRYRAKESLIMGARCK